MTDRDRDGSAARIDWAARPPPGYRRDARGNLIAEANIGDTDRDMDETVLRIHDFGVALSGTLYRFRLHALDDVSELSDRIVTRYGGRAPGGKRGNVTLTSIDGCRRVVLAQAEYVSVGPEIAAAQALIGECLDEWAVGARKNLQALVDQAFRPRDDGSLSVTRLLALRRIRIEDPRWDSVRDAIGDALRPTGRAEYVRLYRRETPVDPWQPVPLTIASALRPPADTGGGGEPRDLFAVRVRRAAADARASGLSQAEIRTAVLEAIRLRPRKEAPADDE